MVYIRSRTDVRIVPKGEVKMKKRLALILAIVMVLMLGGCQLNLNNKGKVKPSRGSIEGDVYTNEYLGFQFTKPGSWVYSTDEEIAAAMKLGAETILGDNFKDTLESNPSVYDMMVVDMYTRTNINVGYENLSKTFSTNITIEQYVEALKKQLAGVSGMTVTFPETFDTVKLGETEFTRVICSTAVQGVSMTQVYYLKKVNGYMSLVIVTIPSEYTVNQIEAMFQ